MTKKFYNLPRQYSTTTGDSDIELGAAVPGCKTLAQAGFVDSDELNYGIVTYDTATHRPIGTEVGLGKYLASDSDGGPYLQRTTVYGSVSQDTDDVMDSHITLTGLSEVYVPWLAEDILRVRESDSDPSAYPVNTIVFPAGSVTDNGSGVVTVDFSADSDVVTLTGTQTLTNKTLTAPTISLATLSNPIITTAVAYSDNVRQTFNPGANHAGINVGATSDDPSVPVNGDLWYNSTDNTLDARINGATVALGAGSGDVYDSDVIMQDITTGNADSDSHGFLLKLSMDTAKFLRADGSWEAPPAGGTVYDSDVVMQDITTNNADSDAHGLLLKLSMNTAHFLRADGSWQAPPAGGTVYDSDIVFSDTTANNADSAEHGFLPKLSADSTEFLNGKGEWVTGGGIGDVVGPATSTDHGIARYDGTGGTTLLDSGITIDDSDNMAGNNGTLAGFSGAINTQTGTTYTTQDSDNGKVVTLSNASPITITVHQAAAAGFNCLIVQLAAGQVTVAAGGTGNVRNFSSHTKLAGQYAMGSLFVVSNAGTAPEVYLSGNTGT